MNAPFKANVWKSVSVPVEITKADLHKMLDVNELKFECRRRGIKLKEDYDGRKYKILRVDMDEVESLYRRGDIEGALMHLGRLLPSTMRNFDCEVARHYGRAA